MYGAGNIGRGFIGQQFYEAGYEVVFIDVNQAVIEALNEAGRYPIKIVSNKHKEDVWVENVSAIDGRDLDLVAQTIAQADLMATAVGVNVLPHIMEAIAKGLKQRWLVNNYEPLNILLCENLIHADDFVLNELKNWLDIDDMKLVEAYVGLVTTSIGRMVPVMSEERSNGNLLSIWVEPYCQLPVNKDAFKGQIPDIATLVPYSPFEYYVEKKLFVHNMGHAMTAYLGQLGGYTYIWEAIKDPNIKMIVLKAMQESAIALARKYDQPLDGLLQHVDDLLYRFANPYLGDTIARVGKDPIRKLRTNDRLIGAAKCCLDQGVYPVYISFGVGAALLFEDAEDAALSGLKERVKDQGIETVIADTFCIDEKDWLMNAVVGDYNDLLKGIPFIDLLVELEYQKIG